MKFAHLRNCIVLFSALFALSAVSVYAQSQNVQKYRGKTVSYSFLQSTQCGAYYVLLHVAEETDWSPQPVKQATTLDVGVLKFDWCNSDYQYWWTDAPVPLPEKDVYILPRSTGVTAAVELVDLNSGSENPPVVPAYVSVTCVATDDTPQRTTDTTRTFSPNQITLLKETGIKQPCTATGTISMNGVDIVPSIISMGEGSIIQDAQTTVTILKK